MGASTQLAQVRPSLAGHLYHSWRVEPSTPNPNEVSHQGSFLQYCENKVATGFKWEVSIAGMLHWLRPHTALQTRSYTWLAQACMRCGTTCLQEAPENLQQAAIVWVAVQHLAVDRAGPRLRLMLWQTARQYRWVSTHANTFNTQTCDTAAAWLVKACKQLAYRVHDDKGLLQALELDRVVQQGHPEGTLG